MSTENARFIVVTICGLEIIVMTIQIRSQWYKFKTQVINYITSSVACVEFSANVFGRLHRICWTFISTYGYVLSNCKFAQKYYSFRACVWFKWTNSTQWMNVQVFSIQICMKEALFILSELYYFQCKVCNKLPTFFLTLSQQKERQEQKNGNITNKSSRNNWKKKEQVARF